MVIFLIIGVECLHSTFNSLRLSYLIYIGIKIYYRNKYLKDHINHFGPQYLQWASSEKEIKKINSIFPNENMW